MHNTNSFQIKIDEILNINGIKGNRIKHQTNSLFQFNLNFFMQGIRLKKMTFLERDPIEPHASMENSCHVGSEVGRSHERSSSFTLCPPGVNRSPIPLGVVVLRSSLGLSINTFSMGSFSTP